MKKLLCYLSKFEWILLLFSLTFVITAFFAFDRVNYLSLIASLIGIASLITSAKGNPIGPALMVVFSVLYGIISYSFAYYGEMLTYLGMTLPVSVFALISWIKNPYSKTEVKVESLSKKDWIITAVLSFIVTVVFYFILKSFRTSNLIPSTISVTTSFAAAYLTYKRSPYYAVAYMLNDIVLIVLWSLAAYENAKYISVLVCFVTFTANDLYGFVNWKRLSKKQKRKN